jgi:catechol 2,3-dioxygenase-like lactoylglutathione lyase family enzyme
MTPRIELNHTIVHARDKHASARFLAGILGVAVEPQFGPFLPIRLSNGVTLDFLDVDAPVYPQHYAFLVGEEVFDGAFSRIQQAGLPYWADPFHQQPSTINHHDGGRGVYFEDPDGHNLELITVPYGGTAAS